MDDHWNRRRFREREYIRQTIEGSFFRIGWKGPIGLAKKVREDEHGCIYVLVVTAAGEREVTTSRLSAPLNKDEIDAVDLLAVIGGDDGVRSEEATE